MLQRSWQSPKGVQKGSRGLYSMIVAKVGRLQLRVLAAFGLRPVGS